MPNVTEYISDFLKKEDVGEKGIVVVLKDAGEPTDGKYGRRLVFQIEMPDRSIKCWTPNMTSLLELKKKWGFVTERWVGLEVKLTLGKVKDKDAILAEPFEAQLETRDIAGA